MAPGIRYGRLLQAFLEPPAWAHDLKPKLTDKLVAQAGFALQLLLIPLWVTSMVDVLRLPGAGVPVLRGVVMLLAGAVQARAVPSLLQVGRRRPHCARHHTSSSSSRHTADKMWL
jgi:cytochrome c biogenesis protein CcdA